MSKTRHHDDTASSADPAQEASRAGPVPSAAQPVSPSATAPEPKTGEEGEQDKVAAEIAALNSQILRLRADFENLRKRSRKEQGELTDRIRAETVLSLLPVMDHFEMGMAAARAEAGIPAAILNGFQLVYDQLRRILEQAGVSVIEAADQPFDPVVHECIAHIPSGERPEGMVLHQTRRGYRSGNIVLRPAQVVVSSGPVPAEDATGKG